MSRTADQDEHVVLYDVSPEVYAKLIDALPDVRASHSYNDCVLEVSRVLHGVSPDQYREFLEALGDHSLRHSYDGWDLEMMSPRRDHEWLKKLIGRMIESLTLSLDIPIQSVGSTTLRAEGFQRGVEPDECYYIAHEASVRGKDFYEPGIDPPPDLAIEVDVTSSSVPRLHLFARLGVPEVWRYDGTRLQFLSLCEEGTYVEQSHSVAFPFLAPRDIEMFLGQRKTRDENSLVREFVAHVRVV